MISVLSTLIGVYVPAHTRMRAPGGAAVMANWIPAGVVKSASGHGAVTAHVPRTA